jgi:hypothetical protein
VDVPADTTLNIFVPLGSVVVPTDSPCAKVEVWATDMPADPVAFVKVIACRVEIPVGFKVAMPRLPEPVAFVKSKLLMVCTPVHVFATEKSHQSVVVARVRGETCPKFGVEVVM